MELDRVDPELKYEVRAKMAEWLVRNGHVRSVPEAWAQVPTEERLASSLKNHFSSFEKAFSALYPEYKTQHHP